MQRKPIRVDFGFFANLVNTFEIVFLCFNEFKRCGDPMGQGLVWSLCCIVGPDN